MKKLVERQRLLRRGESLRNGQKEKINESKNEIQHNIRSLLDYILYCINNVFVATRCGSKRYGYLAISYNTNCFGGA